MAPELLLVGSLKKPCDIYAFGMTIYEVRWVLIVGVHIVVEPNMPDFRRRSSVGSC